MCINDVSPIKPKSSGFGYKVFIVKSDGLHSAFTNTLNPWKMWTKATPWIAGGEAGFHVYATRQKAEECVRWYEHLYRDHAPQDRSDFRVFKVKYRNATKQGTGDGGFAKNARVILAQEIYIL